MSKRERRLLVVTVLVALLGLAVLLGRGGDDEPVHATAPPKTTSTPGSPPVAPPPTATANPSLASSGAPELALHPVPVTYRLAPDELRRLLRRPRHSAPLLAGDPFRRTAQEETVTPAAVDLPRFDGIFFSTGAERGAILDGELCYRGERHGVFRLVGVDAEGIVLERAGQRYHLAYDPRRSDIGDARPTSRNEADDHPGEGGTP